MIKRSETVHEAAILDVWYKASAIAHDFLGVDTLNIQKDLIKTEYLPQAHTWIFEENNAVLGFISMLNNCIGGLFIHPAHQNKKIGTHLIDHVKSIYPQLTVSVYEKNFGARSFYTKKGFKETSRAVQTETGEVIIHLEFSNSH